MEIPDRSSVYASLVQTRKACRACRGLVNPAEHENGAYDSGQLGPWSLWQGNQHASVMVVGRDWGDLRFFARNRGHDPSGNPTNRALATLLQSIGIEIAAPRPTDSGGGVIFLTNAILCLKDGGLQAKTLPEWFENCAARFLRPSIDLIAPRVLVSLGESAYRAITRVYGLPRDRFRNAVDRDEGFTVGGTIRYFPMYHCGKRILNTHRPFDRQLRDWARVRKALGH